MTTVAIKEKLQAYINQGDDKLLKLLLALAKEYMEEEELLELSEQDLAVLEERRNNRLNGKSKTYSWPEVKGKIINKAQRGQ